MKNLKYLIVGLVAFVAVGVMGVSAAAYVDKNNMPDGNAWMGWYDSTTVEEIDGVYYVKMGTNIETDLIIQEGEEVVLDLNGYTLSNYTDGCETIQVFAGGKLTIIDSSEEGAGKVTNKASSTNSVIRNQGTLVIEDGNYEISVNYYLIRNEAEMTINGGVFTSTSTNTSMIGNIRTRNEANEDVADNPVIPELTINDGTFTSTAIVVVNNADSVMEINGGTYTSSNSYALYSASEVTINDGKFISEVTSAIGLVEDTAGENVGLALVINGGNFSSEYADSDVVMYYNNIVVPATNEYVTITGGTFSTDVSALLGDSYELDENGTVVEIQVDNDGATIGDATEDVENPQTYDGVVVSVIVGVSALLVIIIGAVLVKKRKLFN